MAPFPEAEDMTIKRLYVALKRNDVQLLQMGAHKLHEKFHTGHKFELLDDLRQILTYIEAENSFVPNDVKELLTKTINDILNGKIHENANSDELFLEDENEIQKSENFARVQENEPENIIFTPKETDNAANENTQEEKPQAKDYSNSAIEKTAPNNETQTIQTTLDFYPEQNNQSSEEHAQNKPVPVQVIHPEESNEMLAESAKNNENQAMNIVQNSYVQNDEIQPNTVLPQAGENQTGDNSMQDNVSQNNEVQPAQDTINTEAEQNNEIQNNTAENIAGEKQTGYIFTEKEPCLDNVAVFYDDKASFIDYIKNKQYRSEFNAFSLGKDASPLENAAAVKNIADIQTDEIGEILKMLN
ncbi:MAG: hypothetical protein LUE64_00005, partial [Candidatus Gastranaerophilales bacterium]|nr:hypothetical protein [Candidatus Gastranaerophilales bacterium]